MSIIAATRAEGGLVVNILISIAEYDVCTNKNSGLQDPGVILILRFLKFFQGAVMGLPAKVLNFFLHSFSFNVQI